DVREQDGIAVPRPGVPSPWRRPADGPARPGAAGRADGGRQRAESGGLPLLSGVRVCRRGAVRGGWQRAAVPAAAHAVARADRAGMRHGVRSPERTIPFRRWLSRVAVRTMTPAGPP